MTQTATAPMSAAPPALHEGAPMSHRQIVESLTGLMLSLFVAMLSSTVVTNALPRILHDLHGGESAYTWVVAATLLTTTASTPIWGKFADLMSKKLLMQISILIFIGASILAGLSQSVGMLIAFRALQGIGDGGILAMTQVIMGAMVSPRERGRYGGYLGATISVATIAGPLIGGVIVDTPWLGWRWCFYIGVPFALAALIVLQKTLHLPVTKRKVSIDYLGAVLITGGVSVLLLWVTLAGQEYPWMSRQTAALVGAGVLTLCIAALVEVRAKEPIIPLTLFRNRTVTLATVAGLFLGVAMFGATVFLAQYFQIARGETPTVSGFLTMPMVLGIGVTSMVIGRLVTRTGRWKVFLVGGAITATTGFALLATMDAHTSYVAICSYMAMVGLGLGATVQNLVMSVQNTVPMRHLGAATATVAFFRSLGGAVGVSVLGAILATRVSDDIRTGLAALDIPAGAMQTPGHSIPDVSTLPPDVARVVGDAFGSAIGHIFLVATPMMVLSVLTILFIKEVPLRHAARPSAESAPSTHDGGEIAVAPSQLAREGDDVIDEQAADSVLAEALAATGAVPVRGTVRDADGAALADAVITLIDDQGHQVDLATTDADGRYLLLATSSGSYVVIGSGVGCQPQAATVLVGDNAAECDLVLTGTVGLFAEVRGALDGKPLPGALVVATDLHGEVVASGQADAHGAFRFPPLDTGTYTLAVRATGYRPAAIPVEVTGVGPHRYEVHLEPAATLSGTVRTADGRPLEDARVTLLDAAGTVVDTALTAADGVYAFTGLDDGEYTVIASGYAPVACPLRVTGRGQDDFDVQLAHGSCVPVRSLDRRGC